MIAITWDESDFTSSGPFGFGDTSGCCDANPGGGHVVTLTISHSANRSRSSDVAYNHYSLLATIEDGWKLGCLGFTCDASAVPRMTDLVGPSKWRPSRPFPARAAPDDHGARPGRATGPRRESWDSRSPTGRAASLSSSCRQAPRAARPRRGAAA